VTRLEEFYEEWRRRNGTAVTNAALDEIAAAGMAMERERLKTVALEELKKVPLAARVLYRKEIQTVRDILDGKAVTF
jgi:hypothetical protein